MKRNDHHPDVETQETARYLPTFEEESLSKVDRMLYEWLIEFHKSEIQAFRDRLPSETWIQLSVATLKKYDSDLHHDLIHQPHQIEKGNQSFSGLKSLLESATDEDLSSQKITIRWIGFKHQRLVGEYKATETEQLHSIEGQVDLATGVTPVIDTGVFSCQLCGTTTEIPQITTSDSLEEPHTCRGCERQGPFNILKDKSDLIDYQELRLQTPPEHASEGVEHLTVLATGDLAGKHTGSIGQRVIINGYLTTKDTGNWERPYLLQASDITAADETWIDVENHRDKINTIEQQNDPITTIVDSNMLPGMHAPKDSDLRMLKMAVLLQACSPASIGGGERGNIHIFACGDPSTGKTDVAELATDIVPRSEFVSTRVTGVGLTAAATNTDINGWTVKAGAIVRANGGLLAIDELDKIDEDAVDELHNPLESQRVSVSIADQSVTFPAETSVLATANPKYGRWDKYEPIADQIDLPSSLLSRFDLIITMIDEVDEAHDKKVADAVVEKFSNALTKENNSSDGEEAEPDEFLQAWVAVADSYMPTLPYDQGEKLKQFYQEVRIAADSAEDAIPTTPRQLEGMVRLATASARARHSDVIEDIDVQHTIELVERSLQDVGIDPDTGKLDADLIETGTSKSQLERVKSVYSIVSSLGKEHDDGVPKKKAIQRMVEKGVDPKKAEKAIERGLQEGGLYEPKEDKLRIT